MTRRMCILALLLLTMVLDVSAADAADKARAKAVKKALSTARTNIKNGTELESTETSLRLLLEDSVNAGNEKIWLTLFEAIRKQYEMVNEKFYLKEEEDTAKFFTHTLHLFDVLESMDSIDARNVKGLSAPRYRVKHAAYLSPYRKNLYSGGGYYMNKKDYDDAYKFFDTYLDCARQPLFDGHSFDEEDLSKAAFWATFCGYKLARPSMVEKYAEEALRDTTRAMYVLQYLAEAAAMKGDTASLRRRLEEGFARFTSNPYFFKQLARFYGQYKMYEEVMAASEKMLAVDSANVAALIARSAVFFEEERYAECIATSDRIIALDATLLPPYVNAGLAYYNQAVALSEQRRRTKAEVRRMTELYVDALPYLESFRRMAPEASDVWGPPLYKIYFTLNMGDKFEEIEKILKENKS